MLGGWAIVGSDLGQLHAGRGRDRLGSAYAPAYSARSLLFGAAVDNVQTAANLSGIGTRTINTLNLTAGASP